MSWQVNFRIFRYKKDGSPPHFETFTLEVRPEEYILDAIERIWANHDRSLVFRHACHHAGCGACGIRVNSQEKLGCTTRIDTVTSNGGTVTIEPLRNMAVISDLAVDMEPFYTRMEKVGFAIVRAAEPMVDLATQQPIDAHEIRYRFENCIECGLCISACPISATNSEYLGPATLAALQRMVEEPRGEVCVESLLELADCQHGLWRCHSAFECSEVCPSNVDPAGLIMALRRQIIIQNIRGWFSGLSTSK